MLGVGQVELNSFQVVLPCQVWCAEPAILVKCEAGFLSVCGGGGGEGNGSFLACPGPVLSTHSHTQEECLCGVNALYCDQEERSCVV